MKDMGELVRILYEDNYAINAMAEILGVSTGTIYYYLDKMGLLLHVHRRNSKRCSGCENNDICNTYCLKQEDLIFSIRPMV